MPTDNTKQTKLDGQAFDNQVLVNKLVIDLVNAPAYAVFMVYKNFKRDQEQIKNLPSESKAAKTLQAILDILKVVLEYQGVNPDSETL